MRRRRRRDKKEGRIRIESGGYGWERGLRGGAGDEGIEGRKPGLR